MPNNIRVVPKIGEDEPGVVLGMEWHGQKAAIGQTGMFL